MKKVEQYIKEHTNRYSNHVELAPYITGFTEWLTIDDARRIAEIAREEIYEWLQEHSQEYVYWMDEEFGKDDLINDLKQAMKDERI